LPISNINQSLFRLECSIATITADNVTDDLNYSYCEEYQWRGITVPRTRACSTARITCPDPEHTVGTATQKCCCETSQWIEEPNVSNCTHKWTEHVKKLIEQQQPAEQISRHWAELLNNSSGHEYAPRFLQFLKNDCILKYGEAGDKLLSDDTASVWQTLSNETRVTKASRLMSVLQQVAVLMADSMTEKHKNITYTNWGTYSIF
uniref:GAIN domain-containing protein n=1 Tax=Gongylonema pulchrum TaxID=637853 RepID=A0A183CYP1_9BILA